MQTFALDHNDRRTFVDEAASKLDYFCPICGAPMIPRRGDSNRHHFAHKPGHSCADTWSASYGKSDWHFSWQEHFPKENREVTLALGNVRHRADVLTGRAVVEFQESELSADQFNDRNTFYQDLGYKVVWLFDLRDLFGSGAITEMPSEAALSFAWENPRKAFRSYDIEQGNVDLFFQLRDEGDGKCIVRPDTASSRGFEEFAAKRWLDADGFLGYVGLVDGACPPPEMSPLEPNESYLRFKEGHGIILNRQQERAIQTVDGATLLLAVPGSGKTTVLIARLAYLTLERGIPPESIIAITYTKAAAKEMRERFAGRFGNRELADRITFCTINKLAKDIYEDDCRMRGIAPRRIDTQRTRGFLRDIFKALNGRNPAEGELIELENSISYAKNMMLSEDERLSASGMPEHFPEAFAEYQSALRASGTIDFDDQLCLAFEALDCNRALWEKWHGRYRYWNVDEAQDTSKLQHNLIYRLVGQDGNIFMVGDEDQSIYGFRGAFPKAMLNFRYVYRNAFVLRIERNYRSGDEIVAAARKFISRNKGRFEKSMAADRGPGSKVDVLEVATRRDQWQAAYDLTRSLLCPMAILYRDNDTAIPLVDRFLRSGAPFRMSSGKKTFFDSAVVRDIRAFLALSLDHHDADAFMRIYYKAGCFIKKADAEWAVRNERKSGPDILDALVKQMSYKQRSNAKRSSANSERFRMMIGGLRNQRPDDAIQTIAAGGYADYLENAGISDDKLDILLDLASREDTVAGFLDRLDWLESEFDNPKYAKGKHGPTLSSIHSSKGLEFDAVLIIDSIDGILPSSQASPFSRSKDSSDAYQEERRLFYVAMTRARDNLVLLRPKNKRTSFIDEIHSSSTDRRETK